MDKSDFSKIKDASERKTLSRLHEQTQAVSSFRINEAGRVTELRLGTLRTETDLSDYFSKLTNFNDLESLALYEISVKDYSFLPAFVRLKKLDIYSPIHPLKAMDVAPLQHLHHLEELDLCGFPLINTNSLSHLKSLHNLTLIANKINDISFISELHSLTEIYLARNNIQDISPIRNLINLSDITATYNDLRDISPIKDLLHLRSVNLYDTKVSDLSPLAKLSDLRTLGLFQTKIKSIQEIGHLPHLQKLVLGNNNIEDYTPLTKLNSLEELYLGKVVGIYNKHIQRSENEKPSGIDKSLFEQLPQLKTLDLSGNEISTLDFLQENTGLEHLLLNDNQIEDITPLENLRKLKTLHLQNNRITILPPWITNLKSIITYSWDDDSLDHINIADNSLENPPTEILRQGDRAIRNYFEQMRAYGEETLHEGKILIVGEAGAGKSTLFLKLQNPSLTLPPTASTLGVNVKEGLRFSNPLAEGREIVANCWDFGGQEVQYNLHQYFITPDALYILVADNRKEHTQWDYWFHIITLLAREAEVIVVLNQNTSCSKHSEFDLVKYSQRFPSLKISTCPVDFAVNDERWEFLQKEIKRKFATLPLLNKPVPRPWIELRNKLLEQRTQCNYIHLRQFYDLCPSELSQEDRNTALNYFHRLGILLNFYNDENLRDIIFLNPNWITTGLYAAISSSNKDLTNGQFSKEWIFKFWEGHANRYDPAEQSYLLRLMLKNNFDICYPIDKQNNVYIIPFLLPKSMPPEASWDSRGNIGIRIQYPFMPQGIMSRLIVQLHDKIDRRMVWQDGALLHDSHLHCKAQILHSYDSTSGLKHIDIRICEGSLTNQKTLLALIRDKIYHIHGSMYANLSFSEMIRCNCEKCTTLEEPSYFSLHGEDGIEGYLREGKETIECRKLKDRVSIAKLLGDVYLPEAISALDMNDPINHYAKMNETSNNQNSSHNDSNNNINIHINIPGATTGQALSSEQPLPGNPPASTLPKGETGEPRDDQEKPPRPEVPSKATQSWNALGVVSLLFILIVATIVLFKAQDIGIGWFITATIAEVLIVACVWTYAVSPSQISEKGALTSFDRILRRLSLLTIFQKKGD